MARTKGAKGKKNLPSNEDFKQEVKSLSMRLLKKIGIQIEQEVKDEDGNVIVDRAFLLKSAQLVCNMHHSIVCDEERDSESGKGGTATPAQSTLTQPNYTQKLVDFSEKKAESDKKKASSQ
jgi:hypothetical protein